MIGVSTAVIAASPQLGQQYAGDDAPLPAKPNATARTGNVVPTRSGHGQRDGRNAFGRALHFNGNSVQTIAIGG